MCRYGQNPVVPSGDRVQTSNFPAFPNNLSPLDLKMGFVLFVLRFYGPVNPMGSCRARSVYLATRLLGMLSPLSG